MAVLADVSKKSSPASLAYASASAVWICRLSGLSLTISTLLPANAMTMFSLACLCSSLTQDLALSSDDYTSIRINLDVIESDFHTAWVMSYTTTAQLAFR